METLAARVKTVAAFCAVMILVQGLAQAQTVRLHGAVTPEKMITAQKAAVEGQAGVKLEVIGNGSGRGLADLISGQADIAMLTGPLKGVCDALNKEKPGSVDAAGLKEVSLGTVKVAVVINAACGVKSLTEAQLHDVLVGKISQWKEVGGADVPVKVVIPFSGDGVRITVQDQFLKGEDFAKSAIVRNSSKDILPVINQLPGAISIVTEKNTEGMTTVACDKEIQMPILLVTKGEPAGDVKKAIEAIKASVK